MDAAVAFFVWVLVASAIGLAPQRYHWRGAIGLIGLGVPLLVWIALDYPWWAAVLAGLAMASILRWPLRFLARRLGGLIARLLPGQGSR